MFAQLQQIFASLTLPFGCRLLDIGVAAGGYPRYTGLAF